MVVVVVVGVVGVVVGVVVFFYSNDRVECRGRILGLGLRVGFPGKASGLTAEIW